MALPATLVNYFDCDQQRKGTGSLSCEIPTGVPTGFFLVDKNWEIDTATEVFNTAYITGMIQAGVFVPFLDAINFTDNSEESVIYTTQLGVKLLARDGKPEFMLEYNKGYSYHAAAWSYNSFGSFNVILTYENGVVFLAKSGKSPVGCGAILKGHTAGLVNTANFMHKDGTESEKTQITVQLLNPKEYNTRGALLDPVSNDFDIESVTGVINADICFDSNVTVDVFTYITASANGAIDILGVTPIDVRALGTSAAITDVVYDPATRLYQITFDADVSAVFETMTIELYDTVGDMNIVSIADGLYQGTSA